MAKIENNESFSSIRVFCKPNSVIHGMCPNAEYRWNLFLRDFSCEELSVTTIHLRNNELYLIRKKERANGIFYGSESYLSIDSSDPWWRVMIFATTPGKKLVARKLDNYREISPYLEAIKLRLLRDKIVTRE